MEHKTNKQIIIWLLSGCFLIFAMVIIGGITRLTHSGLSMTEWNMIMGTAPPLNERDWQELFEKYKQFPEYQHINYAFSLSDFKNIFWWEYLHRLLGRLIGVVFIIPFVYFWIRKKLNPSLLRKLLVIFALGGLQGFIGWYMVKSGLVNVPQVSHYRLAVHLVTAILLFGYVFWVALNLMRPHPLTPYPKVERGKGAEVSLIVLLGLVILQIIYGAFVSGLKAGLVYNTFPKMGSEWIAEGVLAISPLWKNFTFGLAGVQFVHRYIAYAIVILVAVIWFKARKHNLSKGQRAGINALAFIVVAQFLLGVFTLLNAVPIFLAVLHQAGALLLFASVVFLIHKNKIQNS